MVETLSRQHQDYLGVGINKSENESKIGMIKIRIWDEWNQDLIREQNQERPNQEKNQIR